jgi:hypothetical protein
MHELNNIRNHFCVKKKIKKIVPQKKLTIIVTSNEIRLTIAPNKRSKEIKCVLVKQVQSIVTDNMCGMYT